MGKLSFETFCEQWEWPGTPENSQQILLYLAECEELLKNTKLQYHYLFGLPCIPGQERLNYLFRAIFHIKGKNLFTTAAFDGKISERNIAPGSLVTGGIGNWAMSRSDESNRSFSIIFMRELIRLVYSDHGQTFYCHYTPATGILADMIAIAHRITLDLTNPRDARMNALLIAICEQLKQDIKKFSPENIRKYPENVEKAIHYIHLNFQYPINCSAVSEVLQVNRTMLSGEFRKATGTAMKDFILDLRLNKARWLLETGNLKIKDITRQCGFTDTGYFIRVFQKQFKISPTRYKKNFISSLD